MGLTCEPLGRLNCFSHRSKRVNKAPEEPPKRVTLKPYIPVPSDPFPFLLLPRELRDRIYLDLLTRDEHREIWIRYSVDREIWWDATDHCKCHGRKGINDPVDKLTLGLLKTNKQVHTEALETLYGRNNIWVDATPAKTLEFLSQLRPVAREKIQYLKLWLDNRILEKEDDSTTRFFDLPESEQSKRLKQELLIPWQNLCSFMKENLPGLRTLYMTRNPSITFSEWGPNCLEPMWAHFYHQGWIEAIKDIPSLLNLEVEVRVAFEGPHPATIDGFNELRQTLDDKSGFRENSVEWIYTFFQAGDFVLPSVWPTALLMIHLSRAATRGDSELPDEEEGADRALPPLPKFVQQHTYKDAVFSNYCSMGTGGPPRSPDNNR